MKSCLLLALVMLVSVQALTATKPCACSEITTQTDCVLNPICGWSTSCANKTCKDITTQHTCDSVSTCAWGTACADFTKCSDYKVTTKSDCLGKGACHAAATANTDGTFTCETIVPVTCSTFTTQATCTGIQSDSKMCYWTTTCTAQSLMTCTGITDSTFCSGLGCKWGTTCTAPACADITVQATCTSIRADAMESKQICAWASNKCSDATNTSTLTSSTCFTATGFTYKWNTSTSTCDACTGSSSSYSGLLGLLLLVIAMLF